MSVYNVNGVIIAGVPDVFADNMHLDYSYDEESNANYTVIRIYKNKIDGSRQYPFVYAPNGINTCTYSAFTISAQKNFCVVINAGTFWTSGSDNQKPRGLVIQNGVLIQDDQPKTARYYPLTIDENGDLSYVASGASGSSLIANGIVSAVSGWSPCIIDYDDSTNVIFDGYDDQSNAQRQIIGQFGNGDYAIITCEGRNFDHSDGWTMNEARNVCKKLGLRFAYNLDGGGSTETVIGKKQINSIYEGQYGRLVPTFIVFNGSDTFSPELI